jgi:hypothetical protein
MSLGLYLIVIQKARQQLQALLSLTEEAGKYEN